MNAVEEAWRRSELETPACEYHGIFDDTKKRFAKYPRIIKFKLDLLKYLKRRLAAEKLPSGTGSGDNDGFVLHGDCVALFCLLLYQRL